MNLVPFDRRTRYNILVADDDPKWRQFVGMTLESELNTTPVLAANGQEALDILEAHHIDMVVTDLQMPVMNGIEFLQRARVISPATKVIVMSAAFEPSTATSRAFINAGAAATISKGEIASSLANLLRYL